jgi:hypothetical protein
MWLWNVEKHTSFDVGGRIARFAAFRDHAHFEEVATDLARVAAKEVKRYRKLFSNVKAVHTYYRHHRPIQSGRSSMRRLRVHLQAKDAVRVLTSNEY